MIKEKKFDYDFIIIGSGFGGSVSALRLAEKGYRVAVLEKGKRYRTEDFPRTNWNLRKFLWMPALGFYGIQVLKILKHVFILSGAGVGGGSLVYANQLLIPPDEAFDRPEWGPGNWKTKLAPFYQEASRMLGAVKAPSIGKADKALAEVGLEMTGKDTFHINDVGIFFGTPDQITPDPYFDGKGPDRKGCTFCGACMIGCPVGAKNTLDKNYLYLAEKLGVDIIPETYVTGVKPISEDTDNGFIIYSKKSTGVIQTKKTFTASKVIFSGGVLGSVELLMKCRDEGFLPELSPQLGNYIRTNSEALLVVESNDKEHDYSDNIAITSGIYPDKDTHIEIVRYNKGSDVMGSLLTLLTDDGGKVPRPVRYAANIFRHPFDFIKSLWIPGWAKRTSILLVMQTDENHLMFDYKKRWWRLGQKSMNTALNPDGVRSPAYIPIANETAKRLARKLNGTPMSAISEILFNLSSTAHILGGAPMGKNEHEGVCDFSGRIHNYPGLYVIDGSNIPANLGVNPSLTITALAEYIVDQVPDKRIDN